MVDQKITEPGICPYCGAPTDFHYEIEGPIIKDDEPFVEITYQVSCSMCGYNDKKSIYIPLSSLYMLRYMLTPKSRIALERIKILTDIKKIEGTTLQSQS
ncbi:MAG: hypothetical protein ACP5I6_05285 [Caldisphaera sp.]|nr:hypothetical protein [Caldisphaera sp.]